MDSSDGGIGSVRTEGDTTIVPLFGEIDLNHTPTVHKGLVAACESRPKRLVVNLEQVRYIDSSGIGALVEIFRRVNGYGGRMALCCINDQVRSVFEITKLDRIFIITQTEAEALTA